MSKQSEAKQAQGYRTEQTNCGNCQHRTCDRKLMDWMLRANLERRANVYRLERDGQEVSQRCSIGGFAIRKTTCDRWQKEEQAS